jgi:hypothetical protein
MTCRYLNPYDALDGQRISILSMALGGGGGGGSSLLNAYGNNPPKPERKDLTPRQIEWCRANIPAFMPKVAI